MLQFSLKNVRRGRGDHESVIRSHSRQTVDGAPLPSREQVSRAASFRRAEHRFLTDKRSGGGDWPCSSGVARELAECFVRPRCDEAAGCPLVRGSLRSTEGDYALRKQGSHKGAASHGLWCHRSSYAVQPNSHR
jgi:hypothetical protein